MQNTKTNFSRQFRKKYQKIDNKIKSAFEKKLLLFQQDHFHPQLNNHKLTGKYLGFRSINITGDWRAVYEEIHEHGNISSYFIDIGTHSQLYK